MFKSSKNGLILASKFLFLIKEKPLKMINNDKVVNQPEVIENFRTEEGKHNFDFTGVIFECKMDFPDYFFRNNYIAIYV